MRPRFVALLLAVLLSGCQLWLMPPRSVRPLAAPLSEQHQVAHRLEIHWQEQTQSLHGVLTTAPGLTRVEVLTDSGQPVLQLTQTPTHIDINRSPLLPPPISPDIILADLQLVFWPVDSLEKTLLPPWRLERQAGARQLYEGETLRAQVRYQGPDRWTSRATLDNKQYGYQLTITPEPQAQP